MRAVTGPIPPDPIVRPSICPTGASMARHAGPAILRLPLRLSRVVETFRRGPAGRFDPGIPSITRGRPMSVGGCDGEGSTCGRSDSTFFGTCPKHLSKHTPNLVDVREE